MGTSLSVTRAVGGGGRGLGRLRRPIGGLGFELQRTVGGLSQSTPLHLLLSNCCRTLFRVHNCIVDV